MFAGVHFSPTSNAAIVDYMACFVKSGRARREEGEKAQSTCGVNEHYSPTSNTAIVDLTKQG